MALRASQKSPVFGQKKHNFLGKKSTTSIFLLWGITIFGYLISDFSRVSPSFGYGAKVPVMRRGKVPGTDTDEPHGP